MNFYTNVLQWGNQILIREINGTKSVTKRVTYNPTMYVSAPAGKKTSHKSLFGDPLEPIQPGNIKETKEWISQYEDTPGFKIFGNTNFNYCWIGENYTQDVVEYDFTKMSVWSLDIECESEKGFPNVNDANERVNLITFKNIHTQQTYSFGLQPDQNNKVKYKVARKNIEYVDCDTEAELFRGFLDKWAEVQPDIIMGWNIEMFDIPYLINRMYKFFEEKEISQALSPWNNIRATTVKFMNQEKPGYQISGVSILDYMRLYRKYVLEPRENYKLGFIAENDLGLGKLDHGEYDKFSDFYKNDWQKYVDYNIRDVELVEALDKKWKLIELLLMVAYRAKVNFEDVLSQTKVWDMLIYNLLASRNVVIPMKSFNKKDRQYDGAYVKEPKPGLYKYVASFDVQSLYPAIMMILNIGFDTKILALENASKPFKMNPQMMLNKEHIKHDPGVQSIFDYAKGSDMTLSTNGVCYVKGFKSVLSELLFNLFQLRLEYKKSMKAAKVAGNKDLEAKFDISQQAVKIILNSCYGAVGCEYFRYFDIDNAEAVTHTGQFIIQFIENGINEYLNKLLKTKDVKFVIYCDTDSAYICLDKLVESVLGKDCATDKAVDFLVKCCDGPLAAHIDTLFKDISDNYLNGLDAKILKMNREVVADKAIFTSKKRYILNVIDSEGFRLPTPKLKIKGMEIVKASNPKFCRDKMKEAVGLIMSTGDNEAIIKLIESTKEAFEKLPPEEISSPRGVNGLETYGNEKTIYGFKTPLHTKGALLFNHFIREKNLLDRYTPIQEGEKIKYIYLRTPNPIRDKVISFNGELPKELGLHAYIDYETQFNKTFLEPLNIILQAIGWKSERISSLEKWF